MTLPEALKASPRVRRTAWRTWEWIEYISRDNQFYNQDGYKHLFDKIPVEVMKDDWVAA